MNARPPLRVLLAAVALLATAAALAQDVPALPPAEGLPPEQATPATPAAPLYQVEILIFANREFDRGEESFEHEYGRAGPARRETPRTPPVFDDTTFGPLAQNPPPAGQAPFGAEAPLPQQDPLAEEPAEFQFRLLRPEELQLTSQYRILERNPQAYAPLLHGGWVQPGLAETEAQPIDLAMLGATNPMGTIRVYVSRFLHAKVDLSYQDAAGLPATPAAPSNELAEVPIAPRYRIASDRTIPRSGELHYFDHPAFGVLIKVTPIREPATPGTGTRPAA